MNILPDVASIFRIKGKIEECQSITKGHINDSYHISILGEQESYLLQRINSYIFKDVAGLMKNIEAVTKHLGNKLPSPDQDIKLSVLELIPSLNNGSYYLDDDGNYWRMYKYIPSTHVFDIVENETIAYEGGKAFGRFISQLSDLSAQTLSNTIPDFHNLESRFINFNNSIKADLAGRKDNIQEEILFINKRKAQMLHIPSLLKEGKLPWRITHNDTKFNNILFDRNNRAVCIVDLDTVMPGCVLYDFGDAIRTGSNTVSEDEENLHRVDINLDIYKAYTRGFLKETQHSLVKAEIENLAFSARFMTYIIGIRFLTDYLDGDPYFRTTSPEHNLHRARVQFKLLEAMERKSEDMELIVKDACNNCKTILH